MRRLLTGGSGRLGRVLRGLLPDLLCPTSQELDVTDEGSVLRMVREVQPAVIVHAAAFTDVAAAERERARCWNVNVNGTRHVAQAAREVGAKLVHLSSDYVFDGQRGDYAEDDPPGIPTTYYGLTKLVAEEAARLSPAHLILRTSFRPSPFPHAAAFSDLYTGQDYLDVIAPEIALAVEHALEIRDPILHIVTERKSVFELARRRSPLVREGRRDETSLHLPADVSLKTARWASLKAEWSGR
ncbi:NAD(P)-dependent oxidoreductase (plasmid) [Deinococcus metallilatus]|uniref:dTDP-4-dehydrorhamnose reductase n=1 Tax=Deinococcus metallilatus TaxID=1211322 RepID=A0ABR6N0D9_9DEIO|nr:NAD(P)-dependent oxidoreductase [Deinococcus metallilatus]MBB5296966.1 dTDP-4-dehydrorhamnose reductase [Deinococcus metallilatus]QBY06667.1 NAD(P)-dependent oxidoreductase [Deinococcus metallilatus]GMA15135.1 dTDP-4-rhamnose reductase [Deinococcus metallilatus]